MLNATIGAIQHLINDYSDSECFRWSLQSDKTD